ncbi:M28 family peptidase [Paenibacillus anaericanus]|uniref:M28 family peptidase n=2 Tax=Paenibacillus anaericanus TaxID=170367 RepID=A0A3S1BJC2_9BACL|nr:M28 family peptidase [Paenibacillus anaericanus]
MNWNIIGMINKISKPTEYKTRIRTKEMNSEMNSKVNNKMDVKITQPKRNSKRLLVYMGMMLVVLAVGITLGYHQITPTEAPKDYTNKIITLDDVEEKNADFTMTMSHVYEMAKEPHPSGSQEIESVRAYIIEQLDKVGSTYEIQQSSILQNILVKIDAPNTEQGVMFVSHYDSTTGGPGAGDDLISVASMLEALRVVQQQNQLTNDMYFLFTDGEELGLLGAEAFVAANPDMKEKIAQVVNLEARGNAGTLLMFETSNDNKGMVQALSKGVDHVSAFSFLASFYKMMPNDTDLSVFLRAGYSGMNFAMADGVEAYHEPIDNYDNLNRNSAYMYFKTMVDLAHHLSTVDLGVLQSNEDAVYFPFLKGNTLIFSNKLMLISSILVGILSLTWGCTLLLRKECRLKDFGGTLLLILLSALGAGAVGKAGTYLAKRMIKGTSATEALSILDIFFYTMCVIVIIGMLLLTYWGATRIANKQAFLLSSLVILNILNWACLVILNSMAYIFTIPLFLLMIYSMAVFYLDKRKRNRKLFTYVFGTVFGLVAAILYTPILYILFIGLLSNLFFADMIIIVIAILPVAVVLAGKDALHESTIYPKGLAANPPRLFTR